MSAIRPGTTVTLISSEKFRQLMDDKGQSIRKLAAAVGISPARIQQLSAGRDLGINVPDAVAIAQALDRPVRDLFEFPDGEALVRLGLIRSGS